MEYKVEQIRQLAERYFRGETTLVEEGVLRDYFSECGNVPPDLEPCRLMFCHWAGEAKRQSRRKIALKTEKATLSRPLLAVVTAAAAALLVGVFVMTANLGAPKDEIMCYVNGRHVTDPQQAKECALDVIGLINANLQKPAEYLSGKNDASPAIERMEEMLKMLSDE